MNISSYTKTLSFVAPATNSQSLNTSNTSKTAIVPDTEKSTNNASVHIDLSPVAKGMTSASEGKESHLQAKKDKIEKSNLPPEIKELLKRIAESREKLKEKQQELQDVMRDRSLNDEERQTQMNALQQEISSLNSAILLSMNQLNEVISQSGLDNDALTEVMSSIMS